LAKKPVSGASPGLSRITRIFFGIVAELLAAAARR
jgi:hypothetical protein